MRTGLLLGLVLGLVGSVAGPARAQEGKRYAVLVGVNAYEHPKLEALKYAVNDAAELGVLLEKSGYGVTVLTDDTGKKDAKLAPTKANIEGRLKEVLDGAKKGDLVLVCLAGHGLQFEGDKDAYFCPSDAKPFKKEAATLVSLKAVYEGLDGSFAGMKVLLVDACRDDPAAGRGGLSADGSPRPPLGVAAVFSCKAGQRAFEIEKYKHGIFFHHVITGLRGEAADKRGRVTFAGLAEHVGQEVPNDVALLIGGGAVQTPNLKAEYTGASPVLVVKAAGTDAPKSLEDQVAADLRAYERSGETAAQRFAFLREQAPRKLAGWRTAADKGFTAGQVLLARCLLEGIGVEKDEQAAVALYRKAATAGNTLGMINLGDFYRFGRVVERDEKEAVKWYQKAADAGYSPGMTGLGDLYRFGRGVEKDEKEAVRWYQKAADAGNSTAMGRLGFVYETGQGVAKDDREAFKWYAKAADAGYPPGMTGLGDLYRFGRGVEKDEKEAVKWYQKAADAGDLPGMISLGLMYANGLGIEKDEKEAVRWYQKAAAGGNSLGMFALGYVHEIGRGVDKDEKEAVTWYQKAAAGGNSNAMTNLGSMYEGGRGVERDDAEAVRWYRKAAALGNQRARDALKRLGKD